MPWWLLGKQRKWENKFFVWLLLKSLKTVNWARHETKVRDMHDGKHTYRKKKEWLSKSWNGSCEWEAERNKKQAKDKDRTQVRRFLGEKLNEVIILNFNQEADKYLIIYCKRIMPGIGLDNLELGNGVVLFIYFYLVCFVFCFFSEENG